MESACESGKRTANYILNKYKKDKAHLYIHKKPFYFKFFEQIDDILLFYKLPSIVIIIIILFIIIILNRIFS